MSTDVDITTVRRRRYAWLAGLLVFALGTLFALNQAGVFSPDTPNGFRAQLSATVVNVLEQMPAKDHGHANHGAATDPSTLVCGVRIFGLNPADADTLGEVTQVYAYHICAAAKPGQDWILAVKLTGPAVITLAADPPTMAVAEGGAGFRERVRALIPEKYQAEAFNENLTPEGMQELIRRYNEAAKV